MPNVRREPSRIASAREAFLRHGSTEPGVVPEIVAAVVAASWQRSTSAGVDAAESKADFHGDLDTASRLVRCSEAVIGRLGESLGSMPMSIVLTDSQARILRRTESDPTIGGLLDDVSLAPGYNYAEDSVGTNGIGTAFESGRTLYIVGPEHFHEQLQSFACAGSPIRDPLTGRIEGVLDLTAQMKDASPLMHSLVTSAAREIEHNLLLDRTKQQQSLFDAFVRMDSRSHHAIVAVGASVVMENALLTARFTSDELHSIREHARYLVATQGKPVDQIELPSGRVVELHGKHVKAGEEDAGIVLTVQLRSADLPTLYATSVRSAPGSGAEDRDAVFATHLDEESLSPLYKRTAAAVATQLRQRRGVLVSGEASSGKRTVLLDAWRRVAPHGRALVVDPATLDSTPDALFSGTDRLDSGPSLVVFACLDQYSVEQRERVGGLMDAVLSAPGDYALAATVSSSTIDPTSPFVALFERMEASVQVPALRNRTEDILAISEGIARSLPGSARLDLSSAARQVIIRFDWPGNIRQLRDALTSAWRRRPVGEIQADDLPAYCRGRTSRRLTPLEINERELIINALRVAHGNRVRAAAALGIARSSLYRKIESYEILE